MKLTELFRATDSTGKVLKDYPTAAAAAAALEAIDENGTITLVWGLRNDDGTGTTSTAQPTAPDLSAYALKSDMPTAAVSDLTGRVAALEAKLP